LSNKWVENNLGLKYPRLDFQATFQSPNSRATDVDTVWEHGANRVPKKFNFFFTKI